jgi:hypothetical protein
MSPGRDAAARLRETIKVLDSGDERPPDQVDGYWDDVVRMTLEGWAAGIERDLSRAEVALSAAGEAAGAAPTDDQVAALEECLWRVAAATDKVDALISLAIGGQPFMVVADDPRQVTMRPSRDRNKAALKQLKSEVADKLVEARAVLTGERARLRRHQIAHSLAPIHELSDIGVFIRVHHRDGRPFGYELMRWTPERWDEGITELTPQTLFRRRTDEARRGLGALVHVVEALAEMLAVDPTVRVPQCIYYDHDTDSYALEQPSPTGPPKSYEIDFTLEGAEPVVSRRVSSPSEMYPGIEIPFEDGVWRVMRVTEGENGADQTAICRLVEGGN